MDPFSLFHARNRETETANGGVDLALHKQPIDFNKHHVMLYFSLVVALQWRGTLAAWFPDRF